MPDETLTLERWRATWRALGVGEPDAEVFESLMARYDEPQRAYHTRRHLAECFGHWEAVRAEAERPGEVELALWFHDAVYDPRRDDNEAESAALVRELATDAGLSKEVADRVAALVMATQHVSTPAEGDAARLVDVDLAILGSAPERFDEYERDVRREYGWVPDPLFRWKRREILFDLLARTHLYSTERFRQSLESQARANLQRSVDRLGD